MTAAFGQAVTSRPIGHNEAHLLAAGLRALALLAGGCGGGAKSPAVARLGTTPSNSVAAA